MPASTNKFIKIAIDSNVFRTIDFINYLILHKTEISVALPSLVQLEVGYFYLAKGLSWTDFLNYIQKFDAILMDWTTIQIKDVLQNAFAQKDLFPFKDHFRDFIIGTQCEALSFPLITYNTKHFKWLKQISAQTPEAFLVFFEKEISKR
ncbi:MAG: hypothetical protein ACTSRS_07530 [Candidatus Helarchaeota archaeon]